MGHLRGVANSVRYDRRGLFGAILQGVGLDVFVSLSREHRRPRVGEHLRTLYVYPVEDAGFEHLAVDFHARLTFRRR